MQRIYIYIDRKDSSTIAFSLVEGVCQFAFSKRTYNMTIRKKIRDLVEKKLDGHVYSMPDQNSCQFKPK